MITSENHDLFEYGTRSLRLTEALRKMQEEGSHGEESDEEDDS